MSAPRALICSSRLLSRGCATARLTRPVLLWIGGASPQRQLATSAKLQQGVVETPSRGPEVPLTSFTSKPSGSHARSIAILRLPKRASRTEIEKYLQSKGFNITDMQLRLDRFTLNNDKRCFIELANEEQAKKAVQELNKSEFLHQEIIVSPLKEDFVWGSAPENEKSDRSRFFHEHETSASEALKPLLEGRRMLFSVQTPGWGKPNTSVGHNKIVNQVLEEHFEKYGIEAVGGLQPFYGDKKQVPRMLCHLDFKTKSGADQAVQEIHNTEIMDRKVWLQPSVLSPWRAHQIGKFDQALLAELQEKGLASKNPYEDNFVDSDRKKGKKNYKTTRTQRIQKRRDEGKASNNA